MMNYKQAKQIAIPAQNVEIDPRSKTSANGAFNYLPAGDNVAIRKDSAEAHIVSNIVLQIHTLPPTVPTTIHTVCNIIFQLGTVW